MKKSKFTLVELMIVITIIAILSAIAMPVITAALTHAKITKAKTTMTGLQQAIERYYQEYGELPLIGDAKSSGMIDANQGSTKDYEDLLMVLSRKKYAGKGSIPTNWNKRNITFWDPPQDFTKSNFELVDPWGKYYVIWMDYKGKGYIGTSEKGDNSVMGRVHVSSYGPDETLDITTSDMNAFWNGDAGDISTWEVKK